MTCEACGGRGFELVGVEPAGVVALRCGRCARVQRVVADPRPPAGAVRRRSRYLASSERPASSDPAAGPVPVGEPVPAAAPPR
ncbi:hypothetical protein [Quadrisphaera sp. KR29]|uniref:hypothetical protein n=1 Tax=Quadrisphaera sp. KR29 TaxID=3461391 RepID=UPI004044392E